MFKIAVLVSGGGSNLQSIIDSIEDGSLNCEIEYVISDRPCYGTERAEKHGIKTITLDRKELKKDLNIKIDEVLDNKVDLIVLAGFLSILDADFTEKWAKKIINIHPSLLPKYGGAGMYGIKIHRAVVADKEKKSGCTVHFVDSGIDSGEIIFQSEVDVLPDDTETTLQQRILKEEHALLPKAIKFLIDNR